MNPSRWLAVVLAAFVLASPAFAAPNPLCGITHPTDVVLRCDDEPRGPPADSGDAADPATEPSNTAPAHGGGSGAAGTAFEPPPSAATFATARDDPSRVIVRFRPGTRAPVVKQTFEAAGVEVEHEIPVLALYGGRTEPAHRDDALRRLERAPAVESAEREMRVSIAGTNPNDPAWAAQSGLRVVGLPEAWELSRGSEAVVVAVVDTGVDASHPDLTGRVLPGRDFANGDADPADDHGHGTAVAGIVGARTDNREGIAGVCWFCPLVPVKVLGSDGSGTTTAVAAGIVWAVDNGADVVNLSLGGPEVDGALNDAVAYARSSGATVVAAAGNNGVTTWFFPAASPGAIAVAATDDRDRFYSWSNRGPWVAVSAPGCNNTAVPGGYALFCGTSAATPIVAGLAALAISRNPNLGPAGVEQAILGSSVPLGPDLAHGRVDARATLERVPPAQATTHTITFVGELGRGTTEETFRRSVGAGPMTATLRFAGKSRLTLRLLAPDGRVLEQRSGTSPVVLSRPVGAGGHAFVVSGRPRVRMRFTLTVVHVGR
jgi:subtilisin family serine protease